MAATTPPARRWAAASGVPDGPSLDRGQWSYRVGLVGKPSVGKSSLFNALTHATVADGRGRAHGQRGTRRAVGRPWTRMSARRRWAAAAAACGRGPARLVELPPYSNSNVAAPPGGPSRARWRCWTCARHHGASGHRQQFRQRSDRGPPSPALAPGRWRQPRVACGSSRGAGAGARVKPADVMNA